ncbi:hypothetical protein B0A52_03139 [Exophiala mesophila]|uniref:RNase III domain-containing protein n=1 Tax=Exophiala mesophila TaxID=212818 RepID=A0A438NAY1_EXOME|nr:hypothetical protein B0A52_03139 [Exophiala mesophila]
MKAPVKSRLINPDVTPLVCNSDPRKLDDMYIRFLGKGGDKLLSDEVKWLAVTAKSFDHGRRGFNDRLAFLGKRILELQCSLGLLSMTDDAKFYLKDAQHDPFGREHFKHPATNAVEVISGGSRQHFTHYKYLASVAKQYGIPEVVRWHPKKPDNLVASGSEVIHAQALAAIVGALALEQGSAVANRIAKEKVLMLGSKRYIKEGKREEA